MGFWHFKQLYHAIAVDSSRAFCCFFVFGGIHTLFVTICAVGIVGTYMCGILVMIDIVANWKSTVDKITVVIACVLWASAAAVNVWAFMVVRCHDERSVVNRLIDSSPAGSPLLSSPRRRGRCGCQEGLGISRCQGNHRVPHWDRRVRVFDRVICTRASQQYDHSLQNDNDHERDPEPRPAEGGGGGPEAGEGVGAAAVVDPEEPDPVTARARDASTDGRDVADAADAETD